ncbi:MAG TPA: hypothetical protein PLF22_11575 [Pseudomonadales bacterium]|nr:hypothetical protein [Pseudomonadales bacterium]
MAHIMWLIGLMLLAYGGVVWWRKHINSAHNAFQTKMDLAGDEDHARQQMQAYYNKRDKDNKQDQSLKSGEKP